MTIDYVTFSNLIIDDIVLSDGRTFMNQLGGAGTHALVGMRVWNDRLGYVASVGSDLAPALRHALAEFGVDLQGLILREPYQTARAWQLFEPDERRIEIFRTSEEAFDEQKPRAEELAPAYREARGFHLQWGTLDELGDLIDTLRAANPACRLVWEPSPVQLGEPAAHFRRIFAQVDLFSPDRGEAEQITGQTEPIAMLAALLDMGLPLVALRMGAAGSLVASASGELWRVPAAPPARIVDVTGAGNSYCGGFLTGLGDGLEPLDAALRATVSASFALEQFGLPQWDKGLPAEAARRLAWCRERVEAGMVA